MTNSEMPIFDLAIARYGIGTSGKPFSNIIGFYYQKRNIYIGVSSDIGKNEYTQVETDNMEYFLYHLYRKSLESKNLSYKDWVSKIHLYGCEICEKHSKYVEAELAAGNAGLVKLESEKFDIPPSDIGQLFYTMALYPPVRDSLTEQEKMNLDPNRGLLLGYFSPEFFVYHPDVQQNSGFPTKSIQACVSDLYHEAGIHLDMGFEGWLTVLHIMPELEQDGDN